MIVGVLPKYLYVFSWIISVWESSLQYSLIWSVSAVRLKCWIDLHSFSAKPSWGIQSWDWDDMNVTGGVCVYRGGSKRWTSSPVQLLSIARTSSACWVCPFSLPVFIASDLCWYITQKHSQHQVGKVFFYFPSTFCDICSLRQHGCGRWSHMENCA